MTKNESYQPEELLKIQNQCLETANFFVNEIFQSGSVAKFDTFLAQFKDLRVIWILSPPEICLKMIQNAKIDVRHISYMEARR